MVQDDIAILVVSWDGYQKLWEPFFHCFFKYWADCPYPVFLGSNSAVYSDRRVTPVLIGPDRDFSSNLIAMLSQIKQERVLLWLDDVFLSAPVNTDNVRRLITVAQDKNVALVQFLVKRFDPIPFLGCRPVSPEIKEIPTGVPYRVSLNLGFWRKDVLLKLLHSGETAWEIERRGTLRSFESEYRFGCISGEQIDEPPFQFVHGVYRKQWTWEAIRFLQREGLRADIDFLSVQSYWSHLWLHLYIFLRYIGFRFVYRFQGAPGLLRLVSGKS